MRVAEKTIIITSLNFMKNMKFVNITILEISVKLNL